MFADGYGWEKYRAMNSAQNTHKSKVPKHLEKRGRAFWVLVCDEFALEASDLPLLLACCELLDRADEARQKVLNEGLTIVDRFGQTKTHPAVEIERQSLLAFVRIRRELGLDVEPPDSRPPLPRGYR